MCLQGLLTKTKNTVSTTSKQRITSRLRTRHRGSILFQSWLLGLLKCSSEPVAETMFLWVSALFSVSMTTLAVTFRQVKRSCIYIQLSFLMVPSTFQWNQPNELQQTDQQTKNSHSADEAGTWSGCWPLRVVMGNSPCPGLVSGLTPVVVHLCVPQALACAFTAGYFIVLVKVEVCWHVFDCGLGMLVVGVPTVA